MKSVHKAVWFDPDHAVRAQISEQVKDVYFDAFDNLLLPVDDILYARFMSVIIIYFLERLQH